MKTTQDVINYVNKHGTENIHIDWPELLNTKVHGINKSRYIASWLNAGGSLDNGFVKWLHELVIDGEHLREEEIDAIRQFATGGKLEIELSAEKYLKENNAT